MVYFLVEFNGRISVRVYGAADSLDARAVAEARVQMADGNDGIMLDIEEFESVEEFEED